MLDTGRAAAMLDWTPRVTLEDGLQRTWEWFVAHAGVDRERESAAA